MTFCNSPAFPSRPNVLADDFPERKPPGNGTSRSRTEHATKNEHRWGGNFNFASARILKTKMLNNAENQITSLTPGQNGDTQKPTALYRLPARYIAPKGEERDAPTHYTSTGNTRHAQSPHQERVVSKSHQKTECLPNLRSDISRDPFRHQAPFSKSRQRRSIYQIYDPIPQGTPSGRRPGRVHRLLPPERPLAPSGVPPPPPRNAFSPPPTPTRSPAAAASGRPSPCAKPTAGGVMGGRGGVLCRRGPRTIATHARLFERVSIIVDTSERLAEGGTGSRRYVCATPADGKRMRGRGRRRPPGKQQHPSLIYLHTSSKFSSVSCSTPLFKRVSN